MTTHSERKTPRERFEDLLREVGTLLIAFAPLDAAYAPTEHVLDVGALFLVAGVVIVVIAIILESRR